MKYVKEINKSGNKMSLFNLYFCWDGFLDKPLPNSMKSQNISFTIVDSDTGGEEIYRINDYKCKKLLKLYKKLMSDGVVGMTSSKWSRKTTQCTLAVYGKCNFLLDNCLEFIEDTKKVPMELFHEPTPLKGAYWRTPAHKSGVGKNTIFLTESVSSGNEPELADTHFICDLIVQYFKDFSLREEDMINYNINVLSHFHDDNHRDDIFDLRWSDFGKNHQVSFQFANGIDYTLRSDAIFQVFGCPLYISGDGDLYLGYTDVLAANDGLVGALHYKVIDMNKFIRDVTKCIVLNGGRGFFKMRPDIDIEDKWRVS